MKDGDDHNHSVRHIRWLLCALPAWPDSLHFRYINKAPLSSTNNNDNNNNNNKEDNKNGAHAALYKQKLVLHPNKDNNKQDKNDTKTTTVIMLQSPGKRAPSWLSFPALPSLSLTRSLTLSLTLSPFYCSPSLALAVRVYFSVSFVIESRFVLNKLFKLSKNWLALQAAPSFIYCLCPCMCVRVGACRMHVFICVCVLACAFSINIKKSAGARF